VVAGPVLGRRPARAEVHPVPAREGGATRRIRKALAFLRKRPKDLPITDLYLDVTTDDIHVVVSSDQILSAVKSQGQLLLINVSRLKSEIEEKARKSNIKIA